MNQNRNLLLWALPLLLILACQPESVSWQSRYEIPLAKGKATLAELVANSPYLHADPDGAMRVVFRDTIANITPADLLVIPDTGIQYIFKLDSIDLPQNQIVQKITLGQLANQLKNSSDPNDQATGQFILDNHGNTLPFFPPTNGIATDPVDIDASQFFESADILEGNLRLSIGNYLPVALNNVSMNIQNKISGTSIVNDTYATIPAGSTVTRDYDLAGKHVESSLSGQLTNLDVAGGIFVKIDTNDYIELKMVISDVKASQATAAFPSQTLVDTIQVLNYDFEGEFGDIQITKMVIESGSINANAVSTLSEPIDFKYVLLSASKDGSQAMSSLQLDAAASGLPSSKQQNISLAGYTIDLTQDPRMPFNSLKQQIQVSTISSGKIVTLTQQDNVQVSFLLEKLVPKYVEGYIGKQRFTFSGEEALTVLDALKFNDLYIASPSASITFANSVGVDSRIHVRKLRATNTHTGKSLSLTGTPLLAGPVQVLGPNLPDTNRVVETYLPFTPQNSNVVPFVNLQPDKVIYDFEVEANFNGKPFSFDNFATSQSKILALLDVEIPVEGHAAGLELRDTLALDVSQLQSDRVNSAALRLVVKNGFPVQAKVSVWVADAQGNLLHQLLNNAAISAASLAANGRAETPAVSTLSCSLSGDDMEMISTQGKQLIALYTLDTQPLGKSIKLYSDYFIEAQLVGKLGFQN